MSPAQLAPLEHIAALRRWLAESVSTAFREALGVLEPAGTSAGWQRLCAHLGVAAIDAQQRAEVIAVQQPLRGAPVVELAAVIAAIVAQGQQSLRALPHDRSGSLASARARASQLLDRVAAESVESYKRAVLPAPSGMFAHVRTQTPSEHGAIGANVLTCATCGAPQLRAGDFTCAFCDSHMTGASWTR